MSASQVTKKQVSQSIVGAGLSQAVTSILVKNLNAQTVAGANGTSGANLPGGDEVTLSCVVFDESGSMVDDRDAVVAEFAEDLDAIKKSKQADEILMSLWAFNTRVRMIHSFLTLDLVDGLSDYHPDGYTALYDAVLDAFTSLVAYEAELKNQGMRTKINIAVFTDGVDNRSHSMADDVRKVAQELSAKENCTLTLHAFGTDFDAAEIARAIGFPDPGQYSKTPQGRRRAFGTWSSSVIKTSQTTIGGKSQSGFFTP